MNGPLLVLGPQRPRPNLAAALSSVEVDGPVALVTAGWRHDEGDLEALKRDLPGPSVHLPLYRWFDECMAEAPELKAAWRAQQERILAFKRLYRLRLSAAFSVVLRLHGRPGAHPDLHEAELLDAVHALRELDDRVPATLDRIRAAAGVAARPWEHPAVAPVHARIAEQLQACGAVAVAGGHVAVLLNRLRYFGMGALLEGVRARGGALVAWSAGAMALSERVVLYYDDPPEGPSEPEVLDRGLGLLSGRVLFPHPRLRLRLDQPGRLRLLQARFGECLGLENGAQVRVVDGDWQDHSVPGALLRLAPAGRPFLEGT